MKNFKSNENNLEEQISSMLEKVLVDDDTDALTDFTNTSQSTIYKRRGSHHLFNFSQKPNNIPNPMEFVRNNEKKKPNTVSYSNNTNYYFNVLQKRNNSYLMNMRPIDYNFYPG
jgi:hypothetical protein